MHLPKGKRPRGPLRIVAIGGGTGLSSLLRGLKPYAVSSKAEITAVVTVTDDGGSSGRLRRELDILPPGDIRNCMVALSEDEALLSRLFQYRFESGRGLKGHSFGNLFVSALTHLTGDFAKAVALSSEVLASYGKIYPSTASNTSLEARLVNGRIVKGETRISKAKVPIDRILMCPGGSKPIPETLNAIQDADLICLGPGSLYTSVIPNLLVHGIPEAIRASDARKCYLVNLMWQPGETIGYRASDHVAAILKHAGPGVVDTVIANTKPIAGAMRRRYAEHGVFAVSVDTPTLHRLGLKVVGRDLLMKGEVARHSSEVIASVAMDLAAEGRRRRGK